MVDKVRSVPLSTERLREGDKANNLMPPRIVIDTNVVITAQRSRRGASSKLLSLLGTGLFDAHISVPLAVEYEEVLSRQRQQLSLTEQEVTDLVDALCALSVPNQIHFLWRPYLRDAKDEHVLELAVAAGCHYIVTFNKGDFQGAERFRVGIVDPKNFLKKIGVT